MAIIIGSNSNLTKNLNFVFEKDGKNEEKIFLVLKN